LTDGGTAESRSATGELRFEQPKVLSAKAMQPLPSTFLESIAQQYELSPEQSVALSKRLGDQQSEDEDAAALHISVNALRNRMGGVYGKFSIAGKGPGKLRRLHDFLSVQYRQELPDNSDVHGPETDIDAIVRSVRQQVQADIHHRCGTMRVLDMEQPIGIGDIYTNVNILEKLSGRRRLGLNELLQGCDPENFDRFCWGKCAMSGCRGWKRWNATVNSWCWASRGRAKPPL
jgi:hypothetical protein